MDKARLIEILSREHNKPKQDVLAWLGIGREEAQQDLGLTFYWICCVLARSTESRMRSPEIMIQIESYLKSDGFETISNRKWNPIDFFSKEWTRRGKAHSLPRGHSKTEFDLGYAEILNRDKQKQWRMWFADQYADDVRRFFGQDIEEPTLRDQAQPVNDDSALTALGRQLLWEPADRMEIVDQLLRDKRQLIFYGPPGTGKTFVARELARHLMPDDESEFLQFHPSYSYEDFFEGFRPVRGRNRGMPQFALVPGPLKKIAQKAASHPQKNFVLVIDEINRGNLAKIFGELYFLLEYRDKPIRLQYGGQPFSLPKNLFIIGTMNTADRSISHIDAALRRRFHFFPLFPNEEPIEGLLDRYLKKEHAHKLDIAKIVDCANEKLDPLKSSRHSSIGHSYFMRDDLDESWVELIWKYSIMPLIEERFIDQPDRVAEFKLERLRSRLRED